MNRSVTYKVLTLTFVIAVFAGAALAQDSWLNEKPIKNWNSKSMGVPRGPAYSADELERCGHTIRPATLVADKVLEGRGWKLVGEALVWGDTQVVQVSKGFDGQCRPYDYQAFVFVQNKLVGTLSPDLMLSRTDGALFNVDLYNADSIRAEYSKYSESDALCCPSATEAVYFTIDEENGVLIPGDSYIIRGKEETSVSDTMTLEGTKWKWESTQTPVEEIKVKDPSKYTLEFMSEGKAAILADCNRGTGSFTAEGSSLSFSPFAVTKKACPPGSQDAMFLKNLEYVRIMKMEDGKLYLDLFADGGTMMFSKVED